MNMARKWMTQLSSKLQLPGDVLAGLPRIELVGEEECSIETHRGLLRYGEEEIVISSVIGDLAVKGACLRIRSMNRQRIVVIGRISGVELSGK